MVSIAPLSKTSLQLYVHVPFCEKKCHYCDFASWELPAARQRGWTETLLREMAARGQGLRDRPVATVFFGGGTPSVLAPEFLEALVLGLRAHFDCSAVTEWTLECNPSSLNRDKLQRFHDLGFNRVSLGVQSFEVDELKLLGRVHSPEGAQLALEALAEDGRFDFSGDLIFGIPGQSLSTFQSNLTSLIRYRPSHVSFYGLTLEAGTEFHRRHLAGSLNLPEPERYNAQYVSGVETLAAHGYNRYEVSNFAQVGKECQHNQGYWNNVEYLALGPGAHSLLGKRRIQNPHGFEEYLDWGQADFIETRCEIDVLDTESLWSEALFLGLRQEKGILLTGLEKKFQRKIGEGALSKWKRLGYLSQRGDQVQLQGEGWLLLDEITADLLAKTTVA